MVANIREHVEYLFQNAPNTAQAVELREELIANLTDHYNDLVRRGEPEDAAFSTVISGIGDVDELLRGLRERGRPMPSAPQDPWQRSAVLVAGAVALFVLGLGVARLIPFFGGVLSLLLIAAASAILIYNYMTKPRYAGRQDTIVEDFRQWRATHDQRSEFYRSAQALLWPVTVLLYLVMGFILRAWHPGWMIFLVAAIFNIMLVLWNTAGRNR